MGYCCGQINGVLDTVSSGRLICVQDGSTYQLTVPVTETSNIIWFFKETGEDNFTDLILLEDETTITVASEGEYKVIVRNELGTVIVQGTVPCVAIVTPPTTEEEVKARRLNTKAELIALRDSGMLVNPCIYYIVEETKHYYADTASHFGGSSAFEGFGQYKDDEEARTIGELSTGDVYEASSSTNSPAGPYVLRVVRD